jgi:predicted amidohydrolase YtcJ
LSLEEAIWGYTMGAAIASGQGERLGSLSPGKLADLIVLDRDIFSIPPQEIPDIRVVTTVFDGKIVYGGGILTA